MFGLGDSATVVGVKYRAKNKIDRAEYEWNDILTKGNLRVVLYDWEKFKDGLKDDVLPCWLALMSPIELETMYIDDILEIVDVPSVRILDNIKTMALAQKRAGKKKYAKDLLGIGIDLMNNGEWFFDTYYETNTWDDLLADFERLKNKTNKLYGREAIPRWHQDLDDWVPEDEDDGIWDKNKYWME